MIGNLAHLLLDLLAEIASLGGAKYGHLLRRDTLGKNRACWLKAPDQTKDGLLYDVYQLGRQFV